MTRGGILLHPSDPVYDPVVDGVSRGLADLFPPIHNPSSTEQVEDDGLPDPERDGGADEP